MVCIHELVTPVSVITNLTCNVCKTKIIKYHTKS